MDNDALIASSAAEATRLLQEGALTVHDYARALLDRV